MTKQAAQVFQFFATTPKGLELLLVEELRSFGAENVREKLAGVEFTADITVAYRACLWSRLANRILLSLDKCQAETPEQLYKGIRQINWSAHLAPEATMAVNFVSSQSEMSHTLYGAQKVKDAIVDQLRERFGVRPNVEKDRPDVSVFVHLLRDQASVYIDLSGESLHKRGYRLSAGEAPLKENLAAAILLRAGWPAIAKSGGSLFDPMCGSGTLLVEAAMIAGDIAPALHRDYFGFLGWKQHDHKIWESLKAEAEKRAAQGEKSIPDIVGYDHDSELIKIAFENIERAHLRGKIHVEKRDVSTFAPKQTSQTGLVVTNPPYGERLGDEETLEPLYAELGERLKLGFEGWQAAVFTGNPEMGKHIRMRAKKYYALFNGSLPCRLLLFYVHKDHYFR